MNQRLRGGCILMLIAALPLLPGRAAAQRDTVLTVSGDVEHPYVVTMAEYAGLPHLRVRARGGHDTTESDFDGVLLTEFLRRAGMKFLPDVRGERVTTAVVVQGSDSYRAVFSVAELDTAFTDRRTVLADRMNGKPLPAANGPLCLVVPGEKHHARWVRQVVSLTVHKF